MMVELFRDRKCYDVIKKLKEKKNIEIFSLKLLKLFKL